MPFSPPNPVRRGLAAAGTAGSALALVGALAMPAGADASTRVALPDPNYQSTTGTPAATDTQTTMALRVYLSGQAPQGRVAAGADRRGHQLADRRGDDGHDDQ